MEKLTKHIEFLLRKNDYVIIPGLGGFVTHQQSAQITSKGIIPPTSTIGFNSRMQDNDGLLALEIAHSENISYHDAVKHLQREIDKIQYRLSQGTKVKIGNIGHIFYNKEKNISFSPDFSPAFFPANFGLKEIAVTKRKKQESISITLPVNRVFRYAAIFLILVSIVLFVPKTGESPMTDYAGFTPEFSIKKNSIIQESIIEETQEIETIEEETVIIEDIISEPMLYHIVVCCLEDMPSADQYCNNLKANDYNNARVLPSVRTNRIVIESFPDKETATGYLQNLRSNKRFKDAWLYKKAI